MAGIADAQRPFEPRGAAAAALLRACRGRGAGVGAGGLWGLWSRDAGRFGLWPGPRELPRGARPSRTAGSCGDARVPALGPQPFLAS